jgi:transcriptional regulator with XRE-family HTH domain
MKNTKNNIISDWLQENQNPQIDKLVEKNLAIANKIHQLLEERGLKPADLARLLDKKPSEISKWLTGTHTFTTKTIVKIEIALGVDIIHIEPQKEYIYFKVMVNDNVLPEALDFEQSHVETSTDGEKKAI